jgi:hypothetical protein
MRRIGPLVALAVLAAAWTFVFVLVFIGGPVIGGLSVPVGLPEYEAWRAERDAIYHQFALASVSRWMPLYVLGLVLIAAGVLLVRRALAGRRAAHG